MKPTRQASRKSSSSPEAGISGGTSSPAEARGNILLAKVERQFAPPLVPTDFPHLLTINQVGPIYGMSAPAVRMAVWREREYGTDSGLPKPVEIAGRVRWIASEVAQHIEGLRNVLPKASARRRGRPRATGK